MSGTVSQGTQGQMLALRKISGLTSELIEWRSNHRIRQAYSEGGSVFDFVKGLRLAARLIYILRNRLEPYSLSANWGQILDQKGIYLSPECDIIIHKKGCIDRWNGEGGGDETVMDFRFVEIKKVVAVISCKSYLSSIAQKKEEAYYVRLKPYLSGRKLWLFAECVPKGKESSLRKKVQCIGYDALWYLYTWDNKNFLPEQHRPLWLKFLQEIDRLGKRELKRSGRA